MKMMHFGPKYAYPYLLLIGPSRSGPTRLYAIAEFFVCIPREERVREREMNISAEEVKRQDRNVQERVCSLKRMYTRQEKSACNTSHASSRVPSVMSSPDAHPSHSWKRLSRDRLRKLTLRSSSRKKSSGSHSSCLRSTRTNSDITL